MKQIKFFRNPKEVQQQNTGSLSEHLKKVQQQNRAIFSEMGRVSGAWNFHVSDCTYHVIRLPTRCFVHRKCFILTSSHNFKDGQIAPRSAARQQSFANTCCCWSCVESLQNIEVFRHPTCLGGSGKLHVLCCWKCLKCLQTLCFLWLDVFRVSEKPIFCCWTSSGFLNNFICFMWPGTHPAI